MEIPTIEIGLPKKRFAQQLGEALETFSVAQVNGLEQQLVDDLYGYMQEHCGNYQVLIDSYLGNHCYRQEFLYSYFGIRTHLLRKNTYLNGLVKKVKKNVAVVRDKATIAVASLYKPIRKSQELILFRYYKKQGFYDPKRRMAVDMHTDYRTIVFAAPASAPGLEGKIKGKWYPLQAEPGHLLVWPGERLETISQGRIKALLHQVQYPISERWALLYA